MAWPACPHQHRPAAPCAPAGGRPSSSIQAARAMKLQPGPAPNPQATSATAHTPFLEPEPPPWVLAGPEGSEQVPGPTFWFLGSQNTCAATQAGISDPGVSQATPAPSREDLPTKQLNVFLLMQSWVPSHHPTRPAPEAFHPPLSSSFQGILWDVRALQVGPGAWATVISGPPGPGSTPKAIMSCCGRMEGQEGGRQGGATALLLPQTSTGTQVKPAFMVSMSDHLQPGL